MNQAPDINLITLFFASIFTSNILLSGFLGMCSFIAISKDFTSSNGLGLAVTAVLVITTFLNWIVYYFVLVSFGLEYLVFIVFIVVIASTVQVLEMVIDRVSPPLYMALGIFLPLITVNCAIMGVALFMQIRSYNLSQSVVFSLGSGIGWWLAIVILASIREKTDKTKDIPRGLKGIGITLITIGLMAMAFSGYGSVLPVQ